jgi:hypothetical protein
MNKTTVLYILKINNFQDSKLTVVSTFLSVISSVSGSLHSSVTRATLVALATGLHPVSLIPGILSTGIPRTPSRKHVRPG